MTQLAAIRLEHPAMLLLAALAAVAWLLHVLRLHVISVDVATIGFWEQARQRAGLVGRRLPAWVDGPVLARMLAIVLLAVALASPYWTTARPGGRLVVLVDTGAGMAISDGNATRLERARRAAAALIDRVPPGIEVDLRTLPDAGSASTFLNRPTPSSTEPTDRQLTDLAIGLTSRTNTHVVVLTDAELSFDSVTPERRPTLWRIVDRADNLGVVVLNVDAEGRRALLGLGRTGREARRVSVELIVEGPSGMDRRTVEMEFPPDSANTYRLVDLPSGETTSVEARLVGGDAMPADDIARVVLTKRTGLTVRLAGDVPTAVRRALASIPGVALADDRSSPEPDMVVYGGSVPGEASRLPTAVVLLNTLSSWGPFEVRPLESTASMPVLPGESMDEARWPGRTGDPLPVSSTLTPSDALRVIWQTTAGPVVAESKVQDTAALFVGLDCRDRAGWTGRVDFPLFWAAVVDWADATTSALPRYVVEKGVLSEQATTTSGTQPPHPMPEFAPLLQRTDLSAWAALAAGVLLMGSWILGTVPEGDCPRSLAGPTFDQFHPDQSK